MKTKILKQSFLHVFSGDCTTVEMMHVFLIIALPIIISVVAYCITHHISH